MRNVPYKDKMEEQLELFQKEMKLQETVNINIFSQNGTFRPLCDQCGYIVMY